MLQNRRKVIIGIHGLENKPSKRLLQEWWKQSMVEGLVAIRKYHALPIFEMVYWADAIYDKPLNADITDKNDPYFLEEIYTPAITDFQTKTRNFRLKAVGFIVKQLKRIFLNQDLSLKNRAVVESFVQRYFHELDVYYKESCNDENMAQCEARKIMVERVVSVLQKYDGFEIFLIGHSMGSILAFDALCFEVPQIKINTFITIGSPLGLPFMVSKIASRQKITQRGKAVIQTPSSIEKSWYNFSDIDDVIALNYKLRTEFDQNDKGVKPIDVLVRNNYTMNDKKNPHSAFGYLRSKAFSVVLSAFIEEEPPRIPWRAFNVIKNIFQKRKKSKRENIHKKPKF
jgi:hypothetical protein